MIKNPLNMKSIIFDALKSKLAGTGIIKITLVFNLDDNTYNVMLKNKDNSNMKLDITVDEITTIKKLFIRRIVSKWNEDYNIEPKVVIIQMDIITETFEIFMQDEKEKVHKFDY